MDHDRIARQSVGPWLWVLAVAAASLVLSRAFACAMPFAAVATFAASTMPRRQAMASVVLAWSGNQVVGFAVMHYPQTAATFGWGVGIGVGALAALVAARAVASRTDGSPLVGAMASLACASCAYEAVLSIATIVLPSGPGAFAPLVLLRILAVNAVALGLFTAAHRLVPAARAERPTTAASRG